VTPGQARRKFADFFRNFRGEPTAEFPDGRLVYRDKLDQAGVQSIRKTTTSRSWTRDTACFFCKCVD
jgi:hypothetical protein